MSLRSISATMPSTVTRIGPAASLVETAGSRTVRAAPLASKSWTRFSPSLATGKGRAQGGDDERRGPQIKVLSMSASVFGEGAHKLHPGCLGRHAGADQRGAALLLHRRGEILHGTHVEPARRSILALGQADRFAGDQSAPLQGFALLQKLLAVDGLNRRDDRSSGNGAHSPGQSLYRSSGHSCAPARFRCHTGSVAKFGF